MQQIKNCIDSLNKDIGQTETTAIIRGLNDEKNTLSFDEKCKFLKSEALSVEKKIANQK